LVLDYNFSKPQNRPRPRP